MYRVIQLTNPAVGAVQPNALLPLGAISRRYGCKCNNNSSVFEVSTTGSNTIIINEEGYYHLSYVGSLTAEEAGEIIIDLLVNGAEIITAAQTSTAADDTENISMEYIIRVLPSCCACQNTPAIVQIRLDAESVALTGGTSNIIIEKTR